MPRSKEGLARLVEKEGISPRVVAAFRTVDRRDFVPHSASGDAYKDRPIGILEAQTTSQPSLIARMLDAARPAASDHMLEVGTGFGFQTALLAQLVRSVVTIDRHESIADAARANLGRVGITNVEVVVGDGWRGWSESAPYDAIIVSAAASELPSAFAEQLRLGGRLVIPLRVGSTDEVLLFQKTDEGLRRQGLLTPARFVPLVRGLPDPDPVTQNE